MLKAPVLISSDLHFSVLQNRPNRGPLICLKICSKKLQKKFNNDAICPLPILNLDPKGTWDKNGFHIVFLIFNSLLFFESFSFSLFRTWEMRSRRNRFELATRLNGRRLNQSEGSTNDLLRRKLNIMLFTSLQNMTAEILGNGEMWTLDLSI